jgi:ABC-type bacteriocin/lantibiotic exporter with double-glycine peptidase domain
VKFCKPSFETTYEQFSEFHNDYIQQKNNYNLFFKSYIEFKNLSYRHNKGSKDILHDVNIKILKNSSVAILGENGSGKSTFLDLISGLIKPTAGTVSIDSKYNIFDNKISWLNKLSYVQQDIFLLNSSIKNNITLQEDADVILDKKFDEISRVLQLDNVFKDFPEKLYTKISKTSINLSGGQKQLISIARALYKDSEVILLDEPNSALDSNNLALFKDLILSLKGKKTIVMIIHDINKFDKCFDSVYQIDGGSINIV